MNSDQVRANITLSTGAVVTHARMANGAQEAIVSGRQSGEMTHAEWEEYVAIIRAENVAKLARPTDGAPFVGNRHRLAIQRR